MTTPPKKKKYQKYRFTITVFSIFAFCWILVGLIEEAEKILPEVNPLSIFFREFDFSDVYYKIHDNPRLDKLNDILIIDASKASKAYLVQLIKCLNSSKIKPRVIGIDYYFHENNIDKKTIPDSLDLRKLIEHTNNLVLAYRLEDISTIPAFDNDTIPGTSIVKGGNETGFIDFTGNNSTVRTALMTDFENQNLYYSFGLEIAHKYWNNSNALIEKITTENIQSIRISYIPDSLFTTKNAKDIIDHPVRYQQMWADKIVLIGNCDEGVDLHFTPLNDYMAGRSFPDMAGIYIHANVVYTLNNKLLFEELSPEFMIPAASILCIASLYGLLLIYIKKHEFYHFSSMLLYEPAIFTIQMLLSILLYSHNLHIDFKVPYLLFAIAPFAIYLYHLFVSKCNILIKKITNNRFQSPSYLVHHPHK